MNGLLLNILFAMAWVALTGEYTPVNFAAGFILSYLILWRLQRALGPTKYFQKAPQIIQFVIFFLWNVLLANLRVAWEVLTPGHGMRPAIIAVPLDLKTDAEITLLANMITLTPGTLSLDIAEDRSHIYVHAMYVDDIEEFRRTLKDGFEKRVREVMR
jgi:multicomponent Na+:H+ antiporter subunit E